MIKRPQNPFNNIIDIGKISAMLAVIEDLNGFVVQYGISKEKECHIRPSPRSINGKKAQPGCWQIVEVTVGMRHQLIGLLTCGVEG